MTTHHTQLLNALIEKYNLKSYLEIGVQNPANNLYKIKCLTKIGVDPEVSASLVIKMTSDDFFKDNKHTFDIIFIDGLHHADQVKRDFENSLRCLSDTGFIVIHDVLPENEAGTIVPRETKVWWGDVYKWAMNINKYSGIFVTTFNIDNGCMVVRKSNKTGSNFEHENYTWQDYLTHGRKLMNVQNEVSI